MNITTRAQDFEKRAVRRHLRKSRRIQKQHMRDYLADTGKPTAT